MVIYLRHSVHGTKVAVSEEEAKADEKNGWERFQPGESKHGGATGASEGNTAGSGTLTLKHRPASA